ncbi:piwi domain protein [Teladorsagia circumcincta]|uniref:Piwi domain protein n=1 Tax=Teladorsagia circumcincta TaxID=45464 RepID=A0A2G9UJG7_TELCI|nr:piwi domain protein [Teladorsagia circumcincta]
MFVGFDISHAGPQSFADRQMKKVQSEPTVVGMAYTVGEPTRMRGTYWMQEPRLNLISDIASIDPRARPMDQNVPNGTVVEDAMHPAYNEFLIVPQKALQGTARTVRCTLVTYNKGTSGCLPSMEELKQITNILCHGHQVVCGSTTLPSVCFSASNLSKRGRNNWKAENFRDVEGGSVASGTSGGDTGRLVHDGTPDFFKNLSARLHCEINSHYWA